MPIWLELLILVLLTYVVGIGIGWIIWGREATRRAARGRMQDE